MDTSENMFFYIVLCTRCPCDAYCTYRKLHHAILNNPLYVTLDHKTSLKSLGYICSNSQKYIVWVNIIDFLFYDKNY